MLRSLLLFTLFALTNFAAYAKTIHVDHNVVSPGNGTSWAQAFGTLQGGLSVAVDGDEIWITSGTYYPDDGSGVTQGDREASFVLPNDLRLIGGFAGTESNAGDRAEGALRTVLSGQIAATPAGWSYQVVKAQDVYLESIEITSGNANGSSGLDRAAAIYGSNIQIEALDCVFSNSTATFGGSVFFSSHVTATNCVFVGNTAGRGGVIYGGSVLAINCVFVENQGNIVGGVSFNSALTLVNSTAYGNSTQSAGSLAEDGVIRLMNTVIADAAPFRTVAVNEIFNYFEGNSSDRGTNLFVGTDLASVGMSATFTDIGAPSFVQFAGDAASIGFVSLTDLVGPDGEWGTQDDGLRLLETSPARALANQALLPLDSYDLDGDTISTELLPVDLANFRRVQDTGLDLGAYEYGDREANAFLVEITSNVGGAISPTSPIDVEMNTTFQISALPDAGYVFVEWGGEVPVGQITDNPLNLLVDSPKSISVNFGQDLADPDSDGLSNYQESVIYGSNPGVADTSGDGISDGDAVAAGLDPLVDYSGSLFTVEVNAGVGGSTVPAGIQSILFGEDITIAATPAAGYLFDVWSGDVTLDQSTNASFQVTVSSSLNLQAAFRPDLADDDLDGLTNFEEVVTYNTNPALPDSNSDGIEDGVAVGTGLDPQVDYSAVIGLIVADPDGFGVPSVNRFVLNLSAQMGGVIYPDTCVEYDGGSSVQVQAEAEPGYLFTGWIGSLSATDNPLTVIMDDNVTLVAQFAEDSGDPDLDGLSNFEELQTYNTDPNKSDTSGDGILDGRAVSAGLAPLYDHRPFLQFLQANSAEFGVVFDGTVDYASFGEVMLAADGEGSVTLSVDVESTNSFGDPWQIIDTIETQFQLDTDKKFFRLSVNPE